MGGDVLAGGEPQRPALRSHDTLCPAATTSGFADGEDPLLEQRLPAVCQKLVDGRRAHLCITQTGDDQGGPLGGGCAAHRDRSTGEAGQVEAMTRGGDGEHQDFAAYDLDDCSATWAQVFGRGQFRRGPVRQGHNGRGRVGSSAVGGGRAGRCRVKSGFDGRRVVGPHPDSTISA